MVIGVIGSRTFNDFDKARRVLDEYGGVSLIVSGGAKGADSIAEAYAFVSSIPFVKYLPDWDKYGKIAGFIRNRRIVDRSDEIVAFWDLKSPGTKDAILYARQQGKKVNIVSFDEHVELRRQLERERTRE